MKKLIIIETSDVGAKHTAEACKKLGYHPVFICTLDNYQADTYNQIIQYEYYNCPDTTQLEPIIKTIKSHQIQSIGAVISILDSRLDISYQVAKHLKVPGVDKAVTILCDKAKVANLIPSYSPPTITFTIQDIPYNDLKNLLAMQSKLIIKPTRSAGALGMFTVESLNELNNLLSYIEKVNIKKLIAGEWIAQVLLPGRLFSLEGYAVNGKSTFIGFSVRQKLGNTESINHFPANDFLTEKAKQRAFEAVNELVKQSTFKNGYFHTEFIINQEDVYLIDANFGRIGGGGIAQQIAMSYQKEPDEIFSHVIDITLFGGTITESNPYKNKLVKTLSINYGLQEEAFLEKLLLPKNFQGMHTQLLNTGTLIPKMGVNNWSWLSIAVGYPKELLDSLEKITIVIDKGNVKPFYLEGGMLNIEKVNDYLRVQCPETECDANRTMSICGM